MRRFVVLAILALATLACYLQGPIANTPVEALAIRPTHSVQVSDAFLRHNADTPQRAARPIPTGRRYQFVEVEKHVHGK